jgi:hypothetical protein
VFRTRFETTETNRTVLKQTEKPENLNKKTWQSNFTEKLSEKEIKKESI